MNTARFLLLESAFLAATLLLGGPPWTFLATVAVVALTIGDFRPAALLAACPAVVWPALSYASGDRRLFFPFAMHLAAFLIADLVPGRRGVAAGTLVAGTFLATRWIQSATPRVLAVEAVVAGGVLLAAVLLSNATRAPQAGLHPTAVAAIAALCGSLAFLGLAL